MSDDVTRIAEVIQLWNDGDPHAALDGLRAVLELHRDVHVCRGPEGLTQTYGGRDRPPCATIGALSRHVAGSEPIRAPVRTLSDVERLGPLGLIADVLLYGSVTLEDSPKVRNATEQWAAENSVEVTWH